VQKREKRATKRYPKLTKPKEIKEEIWIVYWIVMLLSLIVLSKLKREKLLIDIFNSNQSINTTKTCSTYILNTNHYSSLIKLCFPEGSSSYQLTMVSPKDSDLRISANGLINLSLWVLRLASFWCLAIFSSFSLLLKLDKKCCCKELSTSTIRTSNVG
jgi:hypothetical protein